MAQRVQRVPHLSSSHPTPPPSPPLVFPSGLSLASLHSFPMQEVARCLRLVLHPLQLLANPTTLQMWAASWDPGWLLEVSLAGGSRHKGDPSEGWWHFHRLIVHCGLRVSPWLPGLALGNTAGLPSLPPCLLFLEAAHSHLSPCATVFSGCQARFLPCSQP